jgi:predicted MFS family arabinose efflux permease
MMLGLSLFGLRLCGHGMLGHAGVTSTARLHGSIRGRAVSIAALGFPTGEAMLPGIAIGLIATLGWMATWRTTALIILACLAAGWLARFILKARDPASQDPDGSNPAPASAEQPQGQPVTGPRWIDLLHDRRFVALIPTMVGYPAIATGYFFHQRLIADVKGWPLELLASSITLFALVSVVVNMTAGTLVDRFGAVRLSHFYLLGLLGASLCLVFCH